MITPESLTRALRRSGILGKGVVSAVEGENARSTILSRIVRLRLAYEGEAAGAPLSLIFKTGLPERLTGAWNGGRQEVAFYAKIAAATPPGILPRCFEAEWDEKTNDWRLLLEDLGDSHKIVTTWPLPPTLLIRLLDMTRGGVLPRYVWTAISHLVFTENGLGEHFELPLSSPVSTGGEIL